VTLLQRVKQFHKETANKPADWNGYKCFCNSNSN